MSDSRGMLFRSYPLPRWSVDKLVLKLRSGPDEGRLDPSIGVRVVDLKKQKLRLGFQCDMQWNYYPGRQHYIHWGR